MLISSLTIQLQTISFTCELIHSLVFFFFQAEDGIRDVAVTGVQTCALPICFHSVSQVFESVALADVNKDAHPDIVFNGTFFGPDQPNGPDVYLGDGQGGWKASSDGLKVIQFPSAGIALGGFHQDGKIDIVAGGNGTRAVASGDGVVWVMGGGEGGWLA